jgi:alkaline phosphatase
MIRIIGVMDRSYLRQLQLFLIVLFLLFFATETALSQPKNVILFIGDGMGFEQIKAAGIYANGIEGTLSFETFPDKAEIKTYSANSMITDSAAAATAMATGSKVNNGVISMAFPGDGRELKTQMEFFRDNYKSTGLVTTSYMTDATPAAFGAHEPIRLYLSQIASDYLSQTRPDILFGGGANGMTVTLAEQAGYLVVTNKAEMMSLDTNIITKVSGQFGDSSFPYEYDGVGTLPHLSDMTSKALTILANDPDGFFLMVEGGRIDHAGHSNDIVRNIFETIELAKAVSTAQDWANGRTDTLILVTADHETGGLVVLQNNGQGNLPTVSWSTNGHTGVNVPIYAWGDNAQLVTGQMNNTEIFSVATQDEIPDQFTFIDQTGVTLSTAFTSNTINVSGINIATPISITGGTYSINGGLYTSLNDTVSNGNTVNVRLNSSDSYSTTVNATLIIGGVSDTFSVTTKSDGNTPKGSPWLMMLLGN